MNSLRPLLLILIWLVALLPAGALASIPRNTFNAPALPLASVPTATPVAAGEPVALLTLHLDGLYGGGVLVRQNPWSAFDPEGLVSDGYKKRLNEADQQGRQIEAQRQEAMNKANSDVNAARAAFGKGEITKEQLSSVESSARSQLLKTNQELRQQWENHWSKFFKAEKANGELNSGQYGLAMLGIGAQANKKFGPEFPGIAKIQEGGRIGGTAGAAAALGMMIPVPGVKGSGDVIHVSPNGVAFPPGGKYKIPSHYVENPHRPGSYGVMENGKFVEKLRIDAGTPTGKKGPEHGHYHLDGEATHYSPKPGDPDPGFNPSGKN